MTLLTATGRPMPGTEAELVYSRLLAQMSRAGLRVSMAGCAQLAHEIQEHGHRSREAVQQARALGLDPTWLPRRRSGR